MRARDIHGVKRKLIESLAFLEVKTYKGIRNHCNAIIDIIDEAEYNHDLDDSGEWNEEEEDDEPDDEYL